MTVEFSESEIKTSDRRDASWFDTAYQLLSHERRRHIIACLHQNGRAESSDRILDAVVRMEFGEGVPEQTINDVRSSLYHIHYPKLEKEDIISREHNTVELLPAGNTVAQLNAMTKSLE